MNEGKDLRPFVNEPLPKTMLASTVKGETFMKNFIQSHVPKCDQRNYEKFNFLLSKFNMKKVKKRRNRKKTFLTREERQQLGMLKLPREGWSYKDLEAVRKMWQEYMTQNLELTNKLVPSCADSEWASFSTVLAKSELVGSEVTVVRSKVPSLVGLSGTLVLETKMTIQIVTPDDKLKTIVKDSSVFQFALGSLRFTVFGKHITTRPSERSVKKIKGQMCPDL